MKNVRLVTLLIVSLATFSGCAVMEMGGDVMQSGGSTMEQHADKHNESKGWRFLVGVPGKISRTTGEIISGAARREQGRGQSSSRRGKVVTREDGSGKAYSQELKDAQRKLNQLGYSTGKPDGLMGKKTRAAFKLFQRQNGLKATGILDDDTFHALLVSKHPISNVAPKTAAVSAEKRVSPPANSKPQDKSPNKQETKAEDVQESNLEQPQEKKATPLGVVRISKDTEMMETPDAFSSTLTSLNKGAKVKALEINGDWYKVEYNGKVGYVYSEFISR